MGDDEGKSCLWLCSRIFFIPAMLSVRANQDQSCAYHVSCPRNPSPFVFIGSSGKKSAANCLCRDQIGKQKKRHVRVKIRGKCMTITDQPFLQPKLEQMQSLMQPTHLLCRSCNLLFGTQTTTAALVYRFGCSLASFVAVGNLNALQQTRLTMHHSTTFGKLTTAPVAFFILMSIRQRKEGW